jgi:hypothetical protein
LWYDGIYRKKEELFMKESDSPSTITIRELSRLVKEFEEKIHNGTDDPDRFLTLTEMESLWGKLKGDTNVLYSDMLENLLKETNEKELVKRKKGNSKAEE